MPWTHEQIESFKSKTLEHPLHKLAEMSIANMDSGSAEVYIRALPQTLNAAGVLHGGFMYSFMDTVSYLAAISTLAQGEYASTVDAHFTMLRPVHSNKTVQIVANVVRRHKGIIITEGEAWMDNRKVASANVTKTIVAEDKLED